MPRHATENIRNIALVGHAGSGKTMITEALLHRAGIVTNPGTIERGNTVSDYEPQERALQHSLDSSVCHFDHGGIHVNLIDTPGYPDFVGRSIGALAAADSVAVVINAQTGIEAITRKMMDIARERNLCRMIVVNKIDTVESDLAALLAQIQDAFGSECLPLNLPSSDASSVVDCFFEHGESETAISSVEATHTAIVDQVVEVDEELMSLYLEQGEELSLEQLHDPFEQALREGHLIPVCFVSARSGAGVSQLLEVFERLMPSPIEGNPPQFLKGEGETAKPIEVVADADKHVVAHVFKVVVDPYVGRLSMFRIYQGTVTPGMQLFIGDSRNFKVANLYKIQGKQQTAVPSAIPGDICAVSKIEEITFDDVLHDSHDEDHHHLRPFEMPSPMYGLTILPMRHGDEQKLSTALHKIEAEDPSLRLEHRAALNETVINGVGELHLRIVLEKMRDQFNVEVETRPPSIAYRETITKSAEGHHRHKKQTGGAGQFGEVFLTVEPLARGAGFEFVNKVVGGAIPHQFIPAVEKGVRQVLDEGALAGYAMQDIRVTVHDGKHHSVDSKEVAFVAAGRKAFIDAVLKAGPILLEPIVKTAILVPADCVGDITGDLSARRGLISGTLSLPDNRIEISAEVPLSELENFQSRLKSLSGGEGSYTMALSRYNQVPPGKQKELADEHSSGETDD
ncbi:MAG: elongation factor G [Gammaproteobacteria bacterium]|nr:MAG: elongation factor G [Gammaproteobacteria bacterium]